MTTELDIIDTAVKIGLGAVIGGFTSYFLAIRSQNHDIKTNQIKDNRELIKELSLKIEKVDHLNAEAALSFHSKDLLKAKSAIVSSLKEICVASAFSNIIGNDELVDIINSMSGVLDNIYSELNSENPSENTLYELTTQLIEQKKLAYPFIRESYKNYNA